MKHLKPLYTCKKTGDSPKTVKKTSERSREVYETYTSGGYVG
jgi:hypothetical protein